MLQHQAYVAHAPQLGLSISSVFARQQLSVWLCSMQTSAQVGRTEASAQTAYEQLLEETKQAAARAAAKKAKKLKQKAKKQQDQQPQSPSENEAPSVNGTSQAPDKLLQHDSEADEMTDGVLPMRDLPSSSSLPDAEGSRNMPVVFKADGNATNAAASRDAALQTRHDRIASSLSALSVCDSSEEEEVGAMQEDPDAGHDHAATGQAATAPGHNEVRLDTDTHRLQNIFCCPITKVVPVLMFTEHARQPAFRGCFVQLCCLSSSVDSIHQDFPIHTAATAGCARGEYAECSLTGVMWVLCRH